jgi:hypothetical protein
MPSFAPFFLSVASHHRAVHVLVAGDEGLRLEAREVRASRERGEEFRHVALPDEGLMPRHRVARVRAAFDAPLHVVRERLEDRGDVSAAERTVDGLDVRLC